MMPGWETLIEGRNALEVAIGPASQLFASPCVSISADVHSKAVSRSRPHSGQSIGLMPSGMGTAKPFEAAAGRLDGILLDTAPSTVSRRRRFSGVDGPWNGVRRKDGPASCR